MTDGLLGAPLHVRIYHVFFFFGNFLLGLTKRAFSELHGHHFARKALRLGRRATRDVLCGPDLGDLIIVTLNKCARLISTSRGYLPIVICDLQRRGYPRHHSPYSMRVRDHV